MESLSYLLEVEKLFSSLQTNYEEIIFDQFYATFVAEVPAKITTEVVGFVELYPVVIPPCKLPWSEFAEAFSKSSNCIRTTPSA